MHPESEADESGGNKREYEFDVAHDLAAREDERRAELLVEQTREACA